MKLTLFILITILMMEVNSIRLVLFVSRDEGPTCFYHYLSKTYVIQIMVRNIPYRPNLSIFRDIKCRSLFKKIISGNLYIRKWFSMLFKLSVKCHINRLPICSVSLMTNLKYLRLEFSL